MAINTKVVPTSTVKRPIKFPVVISNAGKTVKELPGHFIDGLFGRSQKVRL